MNREKKILLNCGIKVTLTETFGSHRMKREEMARDVTFLMLYTLGKILEN